MGAYDDEMFTLFLGYLFLQIMSGGSAWTQKESQSVQRSCTYQRDEGGGIEAAATLLLTTKHT